MTEIAHPVLKNELLICFMSSILKTYFAIQDNKSAKNVFDDNPEIRTKYVLNRELWIRIGFQSCAFPSIPSLEDSWAKSNKRRPL